MLRALAAVVVLRCDLRCFRSHVDGWLFGLVPSAFTRLRSASMNSHTLLCSFLVSRSTEREAIITKLIL